MKYNVVVIGIGNVGFSLIELLYEKHKNLNIFAFDIKKPKYLKPFLERKTFNFMKPVFRHIHTYSRKLEN